MRSLQWQSHAAEIAYTTAVLGARPRAWRPHGVRGVRAARRARFSHASDDAISDAAIGGEVWRRQRRRR